MKIKGYTYFFLLSVSLENQSFNMMLFVIRKRNPQLSLKITFHFIGKEKGYPTIVIAFLLLSSVE